MTRTLLVGDEPRDIVFAGSPVRAFITTAHRGQHRTDASISGVPGAGDPQLTTPEHRPLRCVGVRSGQSWRAPWAARHSRILNFFSDTPRALAVSPDRNTVYVAAFKSGNQTTTILEPMVCDGFRPNQPCLVDNLSIMPGGNPGPGTNFEGKRAPETGLIVKFNNAPAAGKTSSAATGTTPCASACRTWMCSRWTRRTLSQTASYARVGTTLFNMVTNPVSGKLYVSNTEAFNLQRFEGPGQFAGQTVQGHLAETRITVISGSTVTPRHLNKHLDYTKLAGESGFDPTARNHSLSTPLDMAVTSNGQTLYVAAFGSSRIGVFSTAALEADTFNPRSDQRQLHQRDRRWPQRPGAG